MNIEPVKNSSKITPKKNETNVQADPAFEKAYAHRQSNAVNAQLKHLERAIQTNYDAKLYRIVVLHLDRAIKLSPVCCRYRVLKAECLAYLGCYDEAVSIAISVMKFDSTSADAFYVRGLCFYYTDNLEEGISHFELALKLNPDHKKAKEMLNKTKSFKDMKENGNALFKSGRYREALAVYTAALKIDEFNKHINSEMLYLRALVRSKINNIRDAVADCTRVLQINDKYLKALLLRALCYNHLEKFYECCNDYETALQIQKTPEIEKMLRDAKLALEELKNKQKNEQQLTQLEQTIKTNYDAKLYSNVVSDLERAIQLSPACNRYRLLKAECLTYLGCCAEAVDIAISVMKLDSTSADAIYVRGLCFYFTDNLEEGINHFELALELDPDHKKAKEMRYKSKTLKDMNENGKVLFKSGRYHEALVCYTDALTIDEFNKTINSKLLTNRALVHSKINNLRDAVEDCTRVLQINDTFLKALLLRARCYKDLEKFDDSCKDYESALKIQNTPDIENMFRDAVNAQKQVEQLRQLEQTIKTNYETKLYRNVVSNLDIAIKLSPECYKYRLLKAECLAYLGCYDEAVEIAISVMKFDSTLADAFYVRGLCFCYTGNLEEGISHFKLALQLDPDHKKAKEMRFKNKTLKDMKENGNVLFKSGSYHEALACYTDALKIDEFNKNINSKLLYNRALVQSKIKNLRDAVEDCTRVLQINDTFLKALLLRARCYKDLEKFDDSCKDYESALKIQNTPDIENMFRDAVNAQKQVEQLKQLEQTIKTNYETKLYRNVVNNLDIAIKLSPECYKYRLLKAECLAYLGCYDEAVEIAISVMKLDSTLADAFYVRGLCFCYTGNLEEGISHFKLSLQLDPDHKKAKEMRYKNKTLKDMKENGNVLFKSGSYREALACYTDALKIDEFNKNINSKLLYNCAVVHLKINNLRDAVEDCTRVLQINDKYLKALLLRARCYKDLEKFDDSCKDYEAALQIKNTPDIEQMLRDAKLALEQSKTKNYYTILGVTRNAGEEEIKKAYRIKALMHHPDRHVNSSPEKQKEQESKFKEIGKAYEILSDQGKKMYYDSQTFGQAKHPC